MSLLHAVLPLLLLLFTATPTLQASNGHTSVPSARTLEGCQTHCGNLTFDYPFGIRLPHSQCFRQPDFELICNNTTATGPLRLFLKDGVTEVIEDIDVTDDAVLDVSYSQYIPMTSGVKVYNMSWNTPGRSLTLSSVELNITGCDFDVYQLPDQADTNTSNTNLLCSVTCPKEITETDARQDCNGTGCCSLGFPNGVGTFLRLQFVLQNDTKVRAEEHPNRTSMWDGIKITTVSEISWAIMDQQTCASALVDKTNYACVSSHSSCSDDDNTPGSGYNCLCDGGYHGNPYISDACTRDRGYNPLEQKVNCSRLCGNISVPFPFGLEQGCSARKLFQLNCTNTSTSSLQLNDGYHVTYINISDGLVGIADITYEEHDMDGMHVPKEPKLYVGSWGLAYVRWAVANLTCQEAYQNTSEYACVSAKSTCLAVNSTYAYIGYRCTCVPGFHGNPYVPHGCEEDVVAAIDECDTLGATMQCTLTKKLKFLLGICICIFTVLTALLGIQVIIHKRSVNRQVLMRMMDEYFQQHGGQLLSDMMRIERNLAFTLYKREDIEAATNNFDKNEIIGQGGQGTVYKGIMDNTPVAIKRCKVVDESRRMEFGQELLILCRVYHDNIVKLLGCCLLFEVPILVYEFVPNKTLHDLLHGQDRRCRITLAARLRIAAESAEALAHLHLLSHPILHGDVKSANILLGDNLVAKVADFGCSIIARMDEEALVAKGTIGYLDPEYLQSCQLTDKSDVYSFGVVLLELLTGKKPRCLTSMFQEALREGTLDELVDREIVDGDDMEVIHQVAELASRCLVMPGESRPAMRQVAQELRRLAGLARQHPEAADDFPELAGSSTMDSPDYTDSKTTEYYSLQKRATLSIEFAG